MEKYKVAGDGTVKREDPTNLFGGDIFSRKSIQRSIDEHQLDEIDPDLEEYETKMPKYINGPKEHAESGAEVELIDATEKKLTSSAEYFAEIKNILGTNPEHRNAQELKELLSEVALLEEQQEVGRNNVNEIEHKRKIEKNDQAIARLKVNIDKIAREIQNESNFVHTRVEETDNVSPSQTIVPGAFKVAINETPVKAGNTQRISIEADGVDPITAQEYFSEVEKSRQEAIKRKTEEYKAIAPRYLHNLNLYLNASNVASQWPPFKDIMKWVMDTKLKYEKVVEDLSGVGIDVRELVPDLEKQIDKLHKKLGWGERKKSLESAKHQAILEEAKLKLAERQGKVSPETKRQAGKTKWFLIGAALFAINTAKPAFEQYTESSLDTAIASSGEVEPDSNDSTASPAIASQGGGVITPPGGQNPNGAGGEQVASDTDFVPHVDSRVLPPSVPEEDRARVGFASPLSEPENTDVSESFDGVNYSVNVDVPAYVGRENNPVTQSRAIPPPRVEFQPVSFPATEAVPRNGVGTGVGGAWSSQGSYRVATGLPELPQLVREMPRGPLSSAMQSMYYAGDFDSIIPAGSLLQSSPAEFIRRYWEIDQMINQNPKLAEILGINSHNTSAISEEVPVNFGAIVGLMTWNNEDILRLANLPGTVTGYVGTPEIKEFTPLEAASMSAMGIIPVVTPAPERGEVITQNSVLVGQLERPVQTVISPNTLPSTETPVSEADQTQEEMPEVQIQAYKDSIRQRVMNDTNFPGDPREGMERYAAYFNEALVRIQGPVVESPSWLSRLVGEVGTGNAYETLIDSEYTLGDVLALGELVGDERDEQLKALGINELQLASWLETFQNWDGPSINENLPFQNAAEIVIIKEIEEMVAA